MAALFADFAHSSRSEHPVHAAADLHWRLSQIHPFVDGNGRTFRLAMNLHLLQQGYPLTIIRSEQNQRVDYYNALAESDQTGKPDAFRAFIELRVEEALRNFLSVMAEVE